MDMHDREALEKEIFWEFHIKDQLNSKIPQFAL